MANGTVDFLDGSNVVREQLALQMQIYALNNGGMVSDSTLSLSSAPFPGLNGKHAIEPQSSTRFVASTWTPRSGITPP